MSASTSSSSNTEFLLSSDQDEARVIRYDTALLRRLAPYLKPHLIPLGGALLLMPAASGAALFQPLLIKKAIDSVLIAKSASALMTVVWLFVAAIAAEFVARFLQTYLMQLAGQRVTADLRRDVFAHTQTLPVRYFDRTPVGRVVTRVTNDIDALTELFSSGAVTAIADLITLVGIVGFMLYLDVELSLVTFVALPFLALVVNVLRRRAREAFRAIRFRVSQLNTYLAEQVSGIAVVQAFGREPECAREYSGINAAYRDANHRAIRYDALLYSVVQSISVASVALVLWYAGVHAGVVSGDQSSAAYVGTVVAFYDYIERFFAPVRDLATKYTIVQSSLAAAERIFDLLDIDETDAPARSVSAAPQVPHEAAVAFRDVTFAYRPGHPVIRDVTFDLRRGERVAIVGATGSGKTTITSLLLRLYEFDEGHVLVNGDDIRTLDRTSLRRRFAVVPQDVFLFSGTIESNIALGDDEIDRPRVRQALEQVGIWPAIEPRGGLRAEVAERGQNFSAGERQLFAFARALYRKAEVVILDEATANVDSETESKLQAAVETLLHGKTSLVIAHRLATIERADRILVFHHGQIVEQGTHHELLAQDGVYAKLQNAHAHE